MSMQTFFIVQAWQETGRGALVGLPPMIARDADHALRLVTHQRRMASGVIAFSRRGDPSTGDYDDPVVLSRWGRVPDEEDLAAAAA
jgi:hypothetical protein